MFDYTKKINVLVNMGILAHDLREIADGIDRGAIWDMEKGSEYADFTAFIGNMRESLDILEKKADERN